MLRKDDSFKVVFNPGSDKVELQGLGPPSTLRFSGDTGSAAPRSRPRTQPRGNLTADLQHSIGGSGGGQFGVARTARIPRGHVGTGALARPGRAMLGKFAGGGTRATQTVPIRKCFGGRNSNLRRRYYARRRGQVRQGITSLPPPAS